MATLCLAALVYIVLSTIAYTTLINLPPKKVERIVPKNPKWRGIATLGWRLFLVVGAIAYYLLLERRHHISVDRP